MEHTSLSFTGVFFLYFELLLRIVTGIRRLVVPDRVHNNAREEEPQPELAEINGGYLARNNSVLHHLEQGLCSNRDGWAVICLHQQADHLADVIAPAQSQQWATGGQRRGTPVYGRKGCLAITFDQLDRTAQTLAVGMLSAQARPKSTLLMLIPNGVEYALLVWCCVILRITYVCVDPDITTTSGYRGLKDILRSVRPSVVVAKGSIQATVVDVAVEDLELSPPIRIALDDDDAPRGWRSFKALIGQAAEVDATKIQFPLGLDDPNRINSIIFTSGTSGIPKGCPLRVSSMCQILESQSWLINHGNSARALQAAHNSRGIAAFQTLQTWKAGGAVMMIANSCDIPEMTEALRYHAPTFTAVSPSMASAIQEEIRKNPFVPSSVQTVQIGGEAVTMDALTSCSTLFPRAKVCVNHGMTEGGGSFYWPFSDTPYDQIPRFGELCPLGAVAPGSAVRVWNSSTRRVVKRGEIGELHIRGGSLLRQYMSGRSPDSFYDDEHGHWIVTGDIAMMDRGGLVFILGRARDTIISTAGIVVPVAIETVIQKLLGSQTAVVSLRHPTSGQVPLAIVKELAGRAGREVVEHVTAVLGKTYLLAGVVSLKQLGLTDFPRNGSGKIAKVELEMAVQKHSAHLGLYGDA